MMEQLWLPLGVVDIISAFNFPAAVWSWNAALALVCGNSVVWKPSEKMPLTAPRDTGVVHAGRSVLRNPNARAPAYLSQVLNGGATAGQAFVDHPQVALVSATGSTRMGRDVGSRVAARFGRCLLELGGNNALRGHRVPIWNLPCAASLFGAYGHGWAALTTTAG